MIVMKKYTYNLISFIPLICFCILPGCLYEQKKASPPEKDQDTKVNKSHSKDHTVDYKLPFNTQENSFKKNEKLTKQYKGKFKQHKKRPEKEIAAEYKRKELRQRYTTVNPSLKKP